MVVFPRVCGSRFLRALLCILGSWMTCMVMPSARAQQSPAPTGVSPSGLWRDVDDKPLLAARGNITAATARRGVVPAEYRTLRLDLTQLSGRLAAAPKEFSATRRVASATAASAAPRVDAVAEAPTEIDLPIPHSGRFARFTVEESPIMEDGLAVRYPQLRTYVAQGIDNPALTARLDLTPQGFHALILSPGGQIYIDPYFADGSDPAMAIAYYKRDYAAAKPFQCFVISNPGISAEAAARGLQVEPAKPTGASLRTYRLAVATTGEYTAAVGGGTVAGALGSVVTTINRVTALYERDFSIRLKLIANEDKIIYTNSTADPYTNDDPDSLLSENQSNLDSVIGTANYDIGHVFSTAGGGLAGLGVVCNASTKAEGETGTSNPTGDPYDIDYVAHEMGHQFGANHTFNSTTGSCGGGNRNSTTAYEPGSGVTIMAYAGICTTTSSNVQDLAPHSDDFFHTVSYDEIDAYTSKAPASTGATTTSTGNTAPTIATPASYTIPINTPFALTASATDAEGDRLTYCWEEFDKGAAVNSTTVTGLDNGASPIFRSYPPTSNPTRTFPSLTYILNNANVPPLRNADGYLIGEALPGKARANGLNFRCTVRDNHAGGGGSNYAAVKLTIASAAGPFVITAPNTAATLAGGSTQTVTWNVASTNVAPVSCANVKISLSADGGLTFPFVLADNAVNTGSAVVVLPNTGNVATKQGRIKVEAVGNIFFDISDANLIITSTNTPPTFTASGNGVTVQRGTPSPVSANVGTVALGSNPLSAVTVSGAPDGATVTGAIVNGNTVQLSAQAECRLTTTLTTRTYPLNVTVTDTAGSTVSGTVNLIVQPNPAPTLGAYADASVGQGGSATISPTSGPVDANFNLLTNPFTVLASTTPAGLTLAIDQVTGVLTATATSSTPQGAVNVRVTLQDACGAAAVKLFTLTVTAPVNAAPVFTNATPPSAATAGAAYGYQFRASGTPTPTFSVTAGTLPPGLALNASTGLLSGTPTAPGFYAGIQVTASNGVGPSIGSAAFSISVANTFSNYAAAYSLSGANAAATADPDGDGITNLMEYALNLNPGAFDAASNGLLNAQVRDYSGTKYLSIRFMRVPAATDLTYLVEASTDLTNWSAVATSVRGAAFSGAGAVTDDASNASAHVVEVRDTVPQDGSGGKKRFLRLRVTQ